MDLHPQTNLRDLTTNMGIYLQYKHQYGDIMGISPPVWGYNGIQWDVMMYNPFPRSHETPPKPNQDFSWE